MNNNYKEIVTKAIIGKGKKTSNLTHTIETEDNINTVLGCWVINHTFNGINNKGKVLVNGTYDINIWYSYDNNTKTNVIARTFTYEDIINVNLKQNITLTDDNEIIVRTLTAPSVSDVKTENNTIKLTVDKELGVEIVGDTKVRINVVDDFDDYDEEIDDNIEINEDYLNGVN